MPPKEEKAKKEHQDDDDDDNPLKTVAPNGNDFSLVWFKDKEICKVILLLRTAVCSLIFSSSLLGLLFKAAGSR